MQPSLFARDSSPIKKQLNRIMQIEICGFWFEVPEKVCMQRRASDPRNALRDMAKKVDWQAVIDRMAKQFESPQITEGFDRLYRINDEGQCSAFLGDHNPRRPRIFKGISPFPFPDPSGISQTQNASP
jgi:hypothetical protein